MSGARPCVLDDSLIRLLVRHFHSLPLLLLGWIVACPILADGPLVQPCACRGSQKWAHEHCLEEWRRTSLSKDAD